MKKVIILLTVISVAAMCIGFAGGIILEAHKSEPDATGTAEPVTEICESSENTSDEYFEDCRDDSLCPDFDYETDDIEDSEVLSDDRDDSDYCEVFDTCTGEKACTASASSIYECEEDETFDARSIVFDALEKEIVGNWEYIDEIHSTTSTFTFFEDGTVKLEAYNDYAYHSEEITSGTWKLVRDDDTAVLVYTLAERIFPTEVEFKLDNYYYDGTVDFSNLYFYGHANVNYGDGNYYKVD